MMSNNKCADIISRTVYSINRFGYKATNKTDLDNARFEIINSKTMS
jgi:hypothetical protein